MAGVICSNYLSNDYLDMTNFTFIKVDFPDLYADAIEAEQFVFISPKASAVLMHSVLENSVNWLYDHDKKLERPWRADLNTLMHEHEFRCLFNKTLLGELHLIRKTGNSAAHGSRIKGQDALACLKYLFRLLRFLAIYYGKSTPDSQAFDENLLPQQAQQKQQDDTKTLKKLLDNLAYKINRLALQSKRLVSRHKKIYSLNVNWSNKKKPYRYKKVSVKRPLILIALFHY